MNQSIKSRGMGLAPILSLLLALCLMVTLGTAAAENRDVFPIRTDDVMPMVSLAVVDGKLLITQNNAAYVYTPGAAEPVLMQEQAITIYAPNANAEPPERFDVLLTDNGQLYAFDLSIGRLYKAALEADKVVLGEQVKLDLGDLVQESEGYTYMERPEELLMKDGFLYMIVRDYTAGGSPSLERFELATGARSAFKTPHINHMAAYKDGKLLVMLWDQENGYDQQQNRQTPAMLGVFDPATDTVTELGELTDSEGSEGNLGYDSDNDIIYSIRRGKLYRRTPDDMTKDELSAYLPSTYFWGVVAGAIAPFDGGVAVLTGDNLFLRDADPAKLPATTLTVYGNYGDDAHRKAQSLMPEVPIQMRDREYFNSAQELGQALVSGENTIDVYFLDYSYIDVKNLMQKQYAYDLSESQKLMDFTKATYPLLQEASFLDGKLLAVPVDAGLGEMWMLFPDRFKETGLEEPATFFDLLDIIGRWPGELAEDFPDITPLQTESYRNQLFYSGMGLYQNLRARNREELRYDDPLFRKMLTAIDNLDTRDLDQQVNWDDMADQDEFFSRMPLIEQTGGVMLDYFQGMNSGSAKLLMLSADEGQPPAVPVMLRVAAINPRSQNIDQAIRYLENYVASLPDAAKAAMMPDMNDPILNPIFEQEMAQMQATADAYKKALETADAAAKGEMEANIKSLEEFIQEYKKTGEYAVSAEGIQGYRAFMESGFLSTFDPIQDGMGEMYTLYDRYLEGQIDMDTLIRESDAKLRLMRLENQ